VLSDKLKSKGFQLKPKRLVFLGFFLVSSPVSYGANAMLNEPNIALTLTPPSLACYCGRSVKSQVKIAPNDALTAQTGMYFIEKRIKVFAFPVSESSWLNEASVT